MKLTGRFNLNPNLCHLCENPLHSFSLCILCVAKSCHQRRILEGLMIQQLLKPSLNRQMGHFQVAVCFGFKVSIGAQLLKGK